jgi:hypothetical protein
MPYALCLMPYALCLKIKVRIEDVATLIDGSQVLLPYEILAHEALSY